MRKGEGREGKQEEEGTKKPRQSHGILNKDDERERGFMGAGERRGISRCG